MASHRCTEGWVGPSESWSIKCAHSKVVGLAHLGMGITELIYRVQENPRQEKGVWGGGKPCRALRHTEWALQCNGDCEGRRISVMGRSLILCSYPPSTNIPRG